MECTILGYKSFKISLYRKSNTKEFKIYCMWHVIDLMKSISDAFMLVRGPRLLEQRDKVYTTNENVVGLKTGEATGN